MTSLLENIDYRGHTIELHYDDTGLELSDVLSDEPCAVISIDNYGRGYTIHDKCKARAVELPAVIRAVYDDDVDALAFCFGLELRTTDKRFGFEDDDLHWHWYKSEARLFDGILDHTGNATMHVQQLSTQRDTYYFVWYQDDLDAYAGCTDAKPMISTVQALLDGEVYGYVIKNGDVDVDSCWGFVGDSEYCLSQARSVVDYHVNDQINGWLNAS